MLNASGEQEYPGGAAVSPVSESTTQGGDAMTYNIQGSWNSWLDRDRLMTCPMNGLLVN